MYLTYVTHWHQAAVAEHPELREAIEYAKKMYNDMPWVIRNGPATAKAQIVAMRDREHAVQRVASPDDIQHARKLVEHLAHITIPEDPTVWEDEAGCWVEARVWVGNCS